MTKPRSQFTNPPPTKKPVKVQNIIRSQAHKEAKKVQPVEKKKAWALKRKDGGLAQECKEAMTPKKRVQRKQVGSMLKFHWICQPQRANPRGRLENTNQDMDDSMVCSKRARRANEVLSKSITYNPEESDGDRWWFQDQHLLRGSRTSGKAKKMNQKGQCPGAFLATPSARRNLSHLGERDKL